MPVLVTLMSVECDVIRIELFMYVFCCCLVCLFFSIIFVMKWQALSDVSDKCIRQPDVSVIPGQEDEVLKVVKLLWIEEEMIDFPGSHVCVENGVLCFPCRLKK